MERLQNRLPRFNSGRGLHYLARRRIVRVNEKLTEGSAKVICGQFGLEQKDLIIFAAGGVFALLVAYVCYKKGLLRKRLSYAVQVQPLVYRRQSLTDALTGLHITFDGREVQHLVRASIYVWNSGNQPITRADLQTSAPLTIVSERKDFTTLQSAIGDQTRTSNNANLVDGKVDFDYLNPGDGFVADIFADATDPQSDRSRSIRLKGEIVGAGLGPARRPFLFSTNRAPAIFFLVIGILLLIVVAAAQNEHLAVDTILPAGTKRWLNLVFAVIFGVSGILYIAMDFRNFIWRESAREPESFWYYATVTDVTCKLLHQWRSDQPKLLIPRQNIDVRPAYDSVSRGLAGVFEIQNYAGLISVLGHGRGHHHSLKQAGTLGENVSPQLATAGSRLMLGGFFGTRRRPCGGVVQFQFGQ
jgi:hypothetical protein